jgi:hypothetical protein
LFSCENMAKGTILDVHTNLGNVRRNSEGIMLNYIGRRCWHCRSVDYAP